MYSLLLSHPRSPAQALTQGLNVRLREFPGSPKVRTLLSLPRAQSVVWELRSHKLLWPGKKKCASDWKKTGIFGRTGLTQLGWPNPSSSGTNQRAPLMLSSAPGQLQSSQHQNQQVHFRASIVRNTLYAPLLGNELFSTAHLNSFYFLIYSIRVFFLMPTAGFVGS